jgi:hypothetical protein
MDPMNQSLYDPEAVRRNNIVNGFLTDIPYRNCKRCVNDTTVPGIMFDSDGVCNFCHLHDKMEQEFPNDKDGEAKLQKMIQEIKRRGEAQDFDCIIGLSGGRDSCFLLYCAVKLWGLRPLAVHFNDGFDNPTAGENMLKACKALNVPLRTITSDWPLARDLKITELKASNPLLNSGTDVGIGASLYSVAAKEGVKTILFGQSFRTEGIKPLSWAYIDGDYLRSVQRQFGTVDMGPWKAERAGYHLGKRELAYYTLFRGIRVMAPLYYFNYIRSEAETIMKREFDWVYPGAHYFDDLYWALIVYIHRTKFNVDLRLNSYSALCRCGQMEREEALSAIQKKYVIEDIDVLKLCVKRLGLTWEQFEQFMYLPPTRFYDLSSSYRRLKRWQYPIKVMTNLGFFPSTVYDKYFNCGA